MIKVLSIAVAVGLASSVATAAVTKDLAYPSSRAGSANVRTLRIDGMKISYLCDLPAAE